MTQEEKQLLLKDLCTRLPYGVMLQTNKEKAIKLLGIENTPWDINGNIREECVITYMDKDDYILEEDIGVCRPYLRPMSSMTEEERKEYELLANRCIVTSIGFIHLEATALIDYLNENHFDYRGLIDKGIAIKVTEENNPYKQ